MIRFRATSGLLALLTAGALVGCSDEEDGRALRAPGSDPPSATAPGDSSGPPSAPPAARLAECTDGDCTVELTAGDRIDFEAGLGIAELRVDDVGADDLHLTGTGEPDGGGVVCSGGCSVSVRGNQDGTTIRIRADAGAHLVLGRFEIRVVEVADGTAHVVLGSG